MSQREHHALGCSQSRESSIPSSTVHVSADAPAVSFEQLATLMHPATLQPEVGGRFFVSISLAEARTALDTMHENPVKPPRPVVILAGLFDPGLGPAVLADHLRDATCNDLEIVTLDFFLAMDFDACRERVMKEIDGRWPSDDPMSTVEVDIIGISMGGLVGRYAARPDLDGRRVNVRRLFTIVTPHLGADLANLPSLDRRIIDMRSGSAFLSLLNGSRQPCDPEIIAYARLGDGIVGTSNSVPPSGLAWWVAPQPFEEGHMFAATDPRIMADIARRIRGEQPFSSVPPTPLDRASRRPQGFGIAGSGE